MNRYERLDYEELESVSFNGGADVEVGLNPFSSEVCRKFTMKVCVPVTRWFGCSDLSKNLTREYNCGPSVVMPPEEMHPWEP